MIDCGRFGMVWNGMGCIPMVFGSRGCITLSMIFNDGRYLAMIEMRLREVNCCPMGKVALQ